MADDVTLPGTGSVIATDDVAGVQFQRVKLDIGGNGASSPVAVGNPVPMAMEADGHHYQPGYDVGTGAGQGGNLRIDPGGNLITRSQVLTDEGGFRANFANSSLSVSIGTCVFVNGSATVTGTGFLATDLRVGDYVKLNADAESAWVQVDDLVSDTELTLIANYTGTGGTGASSRALVKSSTGAGGSVAVASGVCTLTLGTTATSITEVERDMDWLPLVGQAGVSVSQRIANQTIYVGFYDEMHPTTPYWFAWFALDGTTNTTVKCRSGRNPTGAPVAAETEETTVTIPGGATSATSRRYRVEVTGDRVSFFIDGILVATHYKAMPGPGDLLTFTVRGLNGTTPATSTTVGVDYMAGKNHNKVEVGILSDSEQIVAVQPPAAESSYSVAGVITINTILMQMDCSQIRSISVQCTSMGTTGVVTPEWSLDATTWVGVTMMTPAGGSATTFNAAGLWSIPVQARHFRLRLSTATTAGTTTIRLAGWQSPLYHFGLATQPVNGTVTANIGSGALAAGTNLIGDTGGQVRATAGGMVSVSRIVSAAGTTNATSAKASAGRLYKIRGLNASASVRYLKVYNKASAPTVGTDVPVLTLALPASQVFDIDFDNIGFYLATGIAYALTTGSADNDTGALTAADVLGLNVIYA